MTGRIAVIAGPSGSGKNTIVRTIENAYPACTHLVSVTTRMPRPGEIDGKDYHFVSIDEWDKEIATGEIVAERFVNILGGVHYGIRSSEIRHALSTHKVVFALVDLSGAQYLKNEYGATTIFLDPESMGEYEMRLRNRNPEWTEQELEARLAMAQEEVSVEAPFYDHRVVSAYGVLSQAVDQIIELLRAEGYAL